MSETWVFVITDPDKMANFAAKALHQGWMRSVYRVSDEEKRFLRADKKATNEQLAELYDQDAPK